MPGIFLRMLRNFFTRRSSVGLLAWLAASSLLCGCATQRFVSMRDIPLNPLATQLHLVSRSGPQISERTMTLLRHYALQDLYQRDPDACLAQLQDLTATEKGAEKIHAVAELAYILGLRADRGKDFGKALDMYSVSVSNAYIYLFCPELDISRNPYDPQFRGACDVYNSALEATLRLVNRRDSLRPGNTYRIQTKEREYGVQVVARGNWQQADFDHFEFCSDYEVEGLDSTNIGYGIGVPLIAVRKKNSTDNKAESYYPEGLSFPVTALLRVTSPSIRPENSSQHRYPCVLELHDPHVSNDIFFADRRVPLQSDLSTPLAFFLDNPQFRDQTNPTLGLINPNKTEKNRGIYMLEPYDPQRIPVVMVHGLASSPLTWMPMFNDLRSFRELRRSYQFWFYQYPTGQPFWVTATQMRIDLADLRQKLDPGQQHPMLDQMILVGHSMGGLISRMQTYYSDDEFWRAVSDKNFQEVRGGQAEIQSLRNILFFEPNQAIRRVITIGTPHRGSDFANDTTRWLGKHLIQLPTALTDTAKRLVQENPDFFRDTELLTTTTSIDSLAPESPIFPAMLRARRAPWVTYHNIVGVVPDQGFFNKLSQGSDGVVDLQSAHMDDVVSEIVVESSHQDIHRKPRAILEVRRVLVEHLKQLRTTYPDIGQPNLVALVIDDAAHPPSARPASSPSSIPANLISTPTAAGPTRLPPTTSNRPQGQSTRAKAASMQRDLEGVFAPR
jgi:pimeloyl-ACP methyl ester carboxylesterase